MILDWVEGRTGLKFWREGTAALAAWDGKRIRGALVFQSRTPHDVEITVAADDLPRSLLRAGYRYVVGQLGCSRATFRTRDDNVAAVFAMARLGAVQEGRMTRYFGDHDALVFGILKENYRYGRKS